MISVCPSVCGWKAVDSFNTTPNIRQNSFQKADTNCGPWSETIDSGAPQMR